VRPSFVAAAGALLLACGPAVQEQARQQPASPAGSAGPPAREYRLLVASEGNDEVALVSYGPAGTKVERKRKVGSNPTELAGPHGVAVSPDGRFYYVTTAHGMPNGALYKYSTDTDEQLGRVELGLFPATVQVAPGGHYVWAVNFNLYGEHVPSSVSVVYADQMLEVKRIPTCVMPHGSRLSSDGKRHYSACMMDDQLVEIDADRMTVSRRFLLRAGEERALDPAPVALASHGGDGHGRDGPAGATCSPTWAQPSVDDRTIWVACNKSNELVEVDATRWTLRRRVPAGDGIYNLAASPDGKLVVATNKRGQSVSVFDAAGGKELARIPTTRRLPSGLVVSDDSRYAFVTLESVGSEPGAVDVIDLATRTKVASVDVGQQAGGIAFLEDSASSAR
jgi:DNA-binding beta-propeller fold protein YncE